MSETDTLRDQAWIALRTRRQARYDGTERTVCDHATCPGCGTCTCHRKPKRLALTPVTPAEAAVEARRLKIAATTAIKLLDALASTTKTRPVSDLERAVVRGHSDLDDAIRSPTLNGAVSGGDDPSWRMLDQITDRDGNLRPRSDVIGDTLQELVAAIEQVAHATAVAATCAGELRAIGPKEAEQLLRNESDVQSCVNCGCVVTGTRDDRLRAGRCKPCYVYRGTHGGRDRPKHLIDRELAREMDPSDPDAVTTAFTTPAPEVGTFPSESPEVES